MPGFPLWVIVLDYLLGVVMWTLIGRFAMGLFLAPDSSFFSCDFSCASATYSCVGSPR